MSGLDADRPNQDGLPDDPEGSAATRRKPVPEVVSAGNGTTAARLSHLFPAVWRTVTRASRAAESMPSVESQVTILRRLVALGESTPAQLADELRLARPTVSNLLKRLEKDGLVVRARSLEDARSILVVSTERGRSVLNEFRRDRLVILNDALGRLSRKDREIIEGALPALENLLEELELIDHEHAESDQESAESA
ncbi:MarR family transcriptional regulator [Herbiconiux sp. CPCC 205716]|uniref:MarR family transcriptional regulator n=1 Tax=Herbiconiux gentiana TaxID=2970912 RepID=A0ABT2GCY1_9MICO|nr:MarR family transcriptional regulator [Herbiconiux gentiana]MCS5713160.1 MarR family transcriptional regulator [Herbiconiux gentiana]